jgi:hypothetical protein
MGLDTGERQHYLRMLVDFIERQNQSLNRAQPKVSV